MAINPLQPPINYAGMVPQINIGQEFAELGKVLADRQKRTQAEEVKAAYATDLQAAINNPTQETWSKMIAKYPQQREAFAEVRKGYGEVAATNEFNQGFEVSMALENNNPEVAKQKLTTIISARKTSNLPTGIYDQTLAELDRGNIKGAQAGVNYALSMAEPDRFKKQVDARTTAGKAPAELKEALAKADQAVADATTAQAKATNAPEQAKADAALATANAVKAKVEAEFAQANAVLDVQKKSADIRKTNEDIIINRENARIAALNAAIAKETNVIKREEIQQRIDDATEKRNAADREQQATLANQSADIDNFINTAERIKQTPRNIIEAATGPIRSRLPTTNKDVSDFEALVETLGSQAFLTQIPKIKGTGGLSEAEGGKLQASLQNLSLKQSPDRLIENVNEAVRLLEKARVNIALRAGKPSPPSDVPARQEVFVALPDGTRAKFPNQAAADAYKKAAGIK
jgi:hypothetical protein